jgi:dipeptide/tripeptide permease
VVGLLGRYTAWTPAYAGVTGGFNGLPAWGTRVTVTFNALVVCAGMTATFRARYRFQYLSVIMALSCSRSSQ